MSVGNQLTAFLMRVPQDVYDEDAALLQDDLDEQDKAMRVALNSKTDGLYGGVEIQDSRPLENLRRK